MGILDTIKKVFDILPEIGGYIGSFALVLILFGAILGVFVYQTEEGNIPVDGTVGNATVAGTGTIGYVQAQSANYSSLTGELWDSGTAVVGFIVIGVIISIAGVFVGKKLMKGSGGGM